MSTAHEHLVDSKYTFEDLVDIDRLKELFNHFSEVTGFTTGLVSYPEQKLLIGTGWRDICTKFHRAFDSSGIYCLESNQILTSGLTKRKEINICHCKSGLVDGATPIIIKGAHVANLCTGQILFNKPDTEYFRKQGLEYGFNVEQYLKALEEVPVVTEEEFKKTMLFLSGMAVMLAEQGLTNLKNIEAAEAIEKSEAKFRRLVEASSDWIWEIDTKGILTYSSPQVMNLYGYTETEVLGCSHLDFMPQKEASRVRKVFNKLLKNKGSLLALRTVGRHKDSRTIFLETSVSPVLDNSGNSLGFQGITRDVTLKKKAEDEVHHLRNYLSNIIDSMPSLLIGVDKQGQITQWNNEAEKVTGISAEKALGQPLSQAIPRLSNEMARIQQAMKERHVLTDPRQSRLENGEQQFEDITIYPLVANGIEGAVIRVDDVTEQVRLEELMVQSEKMMSIGGIAAGMAHEINNPLASIIQTASVIKELLFQNSPANEKAAQEAGTSLENIQKFIKARGFTEMTDRIHESGSQAAKIVANMLSFARKSTPDFSFEDPAHLLDQSIALASSEYDLEKKYDFREIKIIREYQEDLPELPCEPTKIQQVLLNILRNGAEAMQNEKDRNPDKISQFIMRLAFDEADSRIRIEIEDNGPGMTPETCKRIFEPFFTTKPSTRGTGLGLSVSYFIITDNHGGKMHVRSAPGNGATFIIHLPAHR